MTLDHPTPAPERAATARGRDVRTYDVPVAPTHDDPFVAGSSTVLGGPLGRHSAVRRWLFSIMVIVTLCTAGTAAFGWVQKADCMTHGYTHEYQYTRLCYSDVYALYYAEHLDSGKVPYKDWPVEYPVIIGGAMYVAAEAATLAPTQYRSQWYFTITAGILGASAILLAAATVKLSGRRPWDAMLLALSPLLLFHLNTNWDMLAACFTGFAMLMWARGRPAWCGFFIGLGVATKLYPIVLLGVLLFLCFRAKRLYEWSLTLLAGVATWTVINLPVILLWRSSWLKFWQLNDTRPADWDSLWFQLNKVLPHSTSASGISHTILESGTTAGQASTLLNGLVAVALIVGVALIALLVVLARRRPRVPQVLFLVLTVFLLTNKVFSPQYALWYLPVVVLAVPRWRLLLTWQLTELILVTCRFYYFIQVDKPNQGIGESWFFAAVWLRDVMLVVLMAIVVRDILRPDKDVVRRSGMDDPAGGVLDGAPDDRAVREEPAGELVPA